MFARRSERIRQECKVVQAMAWLLPRVPCGTPDLVTETESARGSEGSPAL